jgi:hypothetical protein
MQKILKQKRDMGNDFFFFLNTEDAMCLLRKGSE